MQRFQLADSENHSAARALSGSSSSGKARHIMRSRSQGDKPFIQFAWEVRQMDHERFRDWFSHVDDLTAAQREEVAAALSGRPQGAASLATIELGVDEERRCAHCGSGGFVSRGKARGLRRYRCKACGKTFGAHRYGAVGSAPQGALAVVRRVVGRRGDDTRVCRALRDCSEHGASLAPPLPGGGPASAGPACRDRRGRRVARHRG